MRQSRLIALVLGIVVSLYGLSFLAVSSAEAGEMYGEESPWSVEAHAGVLSVKEDPLDVGTGAGLSVIYHVNENLGFSLDYTGFSVDTTTSDTMDTITYEPGGSTQLHAVRFGPQFVVPIDMPTVGILNWD
ncbi:MAG: hypothetical protein JW937_10470, partial [Candidatus Omnitrophica bacterium]|nr:hypothetical protein [Candidatus Omnitrophota bacterium]